MKKTFKMPSALAIVMIFLIIVGIMTWFVPTSVVVDNDAGEKEIIFNAAFDPDTGDLIENAGTSPVGLWDLFTAPIKGFADAADVAAAILVSGGLIAILTKVGAMDAGIGALLRKYKGSTLIIILMIVFSLMGTVYGAWEEMPAYAILILPLFVAAGYDSITGFMVIMIATVAGNMADVVNPYAVGAAVAAIGNDELSIGHGILLRLVLYVVLIVMGILYVLRYAKKVKANPESSPVYGIEMNLKETDTAEIVELTPRRIWSLVIFGIVILFCVFGYVPWDSMGGNPNYELDPHSPFNIVNWFRSTGFDTTVVGKFFGIGKHHLEAFGWWYFLEFSAVWLLGAVVIGFINKMPEKEWVKTFVGGCADLMGVVLVLATSRGISVFMGDKYSGMSITFIYWIQNALTSVPLWAFVIAAVIAYLLIGIFLQSTSGVSGITMPIFGAVAMALFASSSVGTVGGQALLISAFTVGINFICGFYPESTNMGICEMGNIPYNIFLKLWLKILIPMLIIATAIISIAPYIGLV
ncbi:MAG: YfcC family protein [Firmicutes bacterium]|nr:YfcC family protein [Bacillota bacterium]